MSTHTLSDFELSRLKRALKAAVATGHFATIEAEARRAHAAFDRKGWPDCHHDWQRALDDCQMKVAHAGGW